MIHDLKRKKIERRVWVIMAIRHIVEAKRCLRIAGQMDGLADVVHDLIDELNGRQLIMEKEIESWEI